MTRRLGSQFLEFVYLAPYERLARSLMPAEVERAFEAMVIVDPNVGDVIPGEVAHDQAEKDWRRAG